MAKRESAKAKSKAISTEVPLVTVDELQNEKEEGQEVSFKIDYRLTKYIKVFDDAIPEAYCEKVIRLFNDDKDNATVRNNDTEKFVALNIENSEMWKPISLTQRKIVEATMPVYAESVMPHQSCFPEQSLIEDFYIYKFRDENDVRKINVDIKHYGQARRYMTMIWFLTTDDDFELGFFDIQNSVRAKAGRLIMFPSTWTYPYSMVNGKNPNFILKSHVALV